MGSLDIGENKIGDQDAWLDCIIVVQALLNQPKLSLD